MTRRPFDFADLATMLQVVIAFAGLIGGVIGFFMRSDTDRRMVENVGLGFAAGGVIGAMAAFAVFAVLKAAGA